MPPSISVFTPCHDATYLVEAHRSLREQAFADWEWVVVANGGVSIPAEVRADERVRVHEGPRGAAPGIGYLKRLACDRCAGDLLVELDHDDLLLPDCLERLVAERAATGAGFLYSDWAECRADGTPAPGYDSAYGWDHYPVTYRGLEFAANAAFDPDPASLHQIAWAPNHVRAWTRAAYAAAGGHDPALAIGDDHDLVCRTYAAGVGFRHVPAALYLYRTREGLGRNTYKREAAALDRVRDKISQRHTHAVLDEWCRRRRLLRVDLGGALGKPAGFVGVDRRRGADVRADLRRGIPLADDSVGRLRAHDFLEHLAPGEEIVRFWNEAYRVLAPGGWLTSLTPAASGAGRDMDPTHKSGWNAKNQLYVTDPAFQRYVAGLTARFQDVRTYELYPSDWHRQQGIPYLHMDLCCLKGQRQPGLVKFGTGD